MQASDLKIGSTFEMDGKVYVVIERMHVNRPRLAALIRTKLKNVETGQVLEKNFSNADKFGDAFIEKKDMQYIYNDGDLYYFMDLETYDQIALNKETLGESVKYITENMIVTIQSTLGRVISVVPPLFVELKIVKCEPGVAGDTAKAAYKPAEMETGLLVKVPLFVNEGEKIKIDTRTDEYIERV
jgi:elongation factor P